MTLKEQYVQDYINRYYQTKNCAVFPVTSITMEMGNFDTQVLKALEEGRPLPQGIDYQYGDRYGTATLREAVFSRDNYTCQCCGRSFKEKVILHVHHVKYRSRGGTDRMANLITVCEKCHTCDHTSKNEGVFSDFDSVIVLSREMDQDELKKVQESFPKAIIKNPILKLDFDCLMSIVRDVSEQTAHFLEDDFPILCQIGDVYLRYDLSYHYSAYKNFHDHTDREVVQFAQDVFVDAYIDMEISFLT